jgi:hypothetical protein
VTIIEASRDIRNPTIVTEPSVRYSFRPVKNSLRLGVSSVALVESGVSDSFSWSILLGSGFSLSKNWSKI